jgi:hypothetical protein
MEPNHFFSFVDPLSYTVNDVGLFGFLPKVILSGSFIIVSVVVFGTEGQ